MCGNLLAFLACRESMGRRQPSRPRFWRRTGSLVIWLPIYLATSPTHLAQIPVADLTVQAVFQGIVVTIVSLVLYVRSVAILGASGGAAFGALVPALTAFIAIPLLGEWPSDIGWVAIVLISAGVYLTSGGPLPRPLGINFA